MSGIQKVLDSIELPDHLKQTIKESWDAEVTKNREDIRKEFSEKLTESVGGEVESLVEAADALIVSTLKSEIEELREDRKQLREMAEKERVKTVKQRVAEAREAKRQAALLDNIITESLKKEIVEFHEDRKKHEAKQEEIFETMAALVDDTILSEMEEFKADRKDLKESMSKMENLVVNQLTRELSEFQEDRKALKEKSAKLEKEYARKLEESKQAFMERASKTISETVDKTLYREITTLKEDIKVAKNNTFGRKIFEAFAAEYLTSHLSEGTEIHKLRHQLEESQKNMQKMQRIIKESEQKINKSKAELREAKESKMRSEKLNDLLRPLNNVQRETMTQLLEGVKVDKLEESFKRYVPAILENDSNERKQKKMISEGRKDKKKEKMTESTGKRPFRNYAPEVDTNESGYDKEFQDIIRLAGIKVNK